MKGDHIKPAKPEKTNLPKRFYENVSFVESDNGFHILLDGRPIKTPIKNILWAPTETLALAIMEEWESQVDFIDPAAMVLTKMMNTAIDRVPEYREAIEEEIVSYAGTDMICYRADGPESLVEMQKKNWNPLLMWAEKNHGIKLRLAEGIIHQQQDEESLQKIKDFLLSKSFFFIAGFHVLTTLSGSVIIALACAEREISAEEAWEFSCLDVNWQAERWGSDEEAERSRQNAFKEFKAAAFLLENI